MRKLILACLLSAIPSIAFAQSGACPTATTLVTNPNWVCLEPSPDHNTLRPLTNDPAVSRYDLLFFAPGVDTSTASPVQTINIGKPTLNAQGVAWLERTELVAIPVGQQYRARAVAVGPDGVSPRSPESNPFGRTTLTVPRAPARVSISPAQ